MLKMVYAILLLVGIVLFAFAMLKLRSSCSFLKNGFTAQATVIDFHTSRGSKGGTMYAPIYQFTTHDQKTITWQDGVSSSPASRKLNEQVKMVYDPANPNDVMIVSYWGTFRWTVVLLAIALPFIVIGGGYFLSRAFLGGIGG